MKTNKRDDVKSGRQACEDACRKKYIVIATTEVRLELNIPIDREKMYGKLDMYKKGMKVMLEITYDTE